MFNGTLEVVIARIASLREEVESLREAAAAVPPTHNPTALDLVLTELNRLEALLEHTHPSLRAAADRERGVEVEARLWPLVQLARVGAASANEAWEIEMFSEPDIHERLGFSDEMREALSDRALLSWAKSRMKLPDPE